MVLTENKNALLCAYNSALQFFCQTQYIRWGKRMAFKSKKLAVLLLYNLGPKLPSKHI